tara:strand:+ start:899 stop:1204 length:306 start_codon:yes stop_codon:yes gene_type:complete
MEKKTLYKRVMGEFGRFSHRLDREFFSNLIYTHPSIKIYYTYLTNKIGSISIHSLNTDKRKSVKSPSIIDWFKNSFRFFIFFNIVWTVVLLSPIWKPFSIR